MNFIKKCVACIMMVALFFFATPPLVKAQVYFGGLDVMDYYNLCDCSGAIYSVFKPLYINGAILAGPLTWYSGSFSYPNYTLHQGAWALGTYMPGIQACWKVVSYFCVPVPALGHILPQTGTSP